MVNLYHPAYAVHRGIHPKSFLLILWVLPTTYLHVLSFRNNSTIPPDVVLLEQVVLDLMTIYHPKHYLIIQVRNDFKVPLNVPSFVRFGGGYLQILSTDAFVKTLQGF